MGDSVWLPASSAADSDAGVQQMRGHPEVRELPGRRCQLGPYTVHSKLFTQVVLLTLLELTSQITASQRNIATTISHILFSSILDILWFAGSMAGTSEGRVIAVTSSKRLLLPLHRQMRLNSACNACPPRSCSLLQLQSPQFRPSFPASFETIRSYKGHIILHPGGKS